MFDRVIEHSVDMSGAKSAPTPLLHKLLTVSIHVAFVAVYLIGLHEAPLGVGIIAVNVSVAHYALLLGLWGPKPGDGGFWWTPSPVHEPFAVMSMLTLGLGEFVALAVISYGQTDASGCSGDVTTLYHYTRNSTRTPPDMPVAEAASQMLAAFGCSVGADGGAVGPCEACGCAAGFLHNWVATLANPDEWTVERGVAHLMGAEGCRDDCLGAEWYMGPVALCVRWTIIDRLWFCFVLLTTVGYGNSFVPSSPLSRQFTLLWALYGLFVFGATSSAWLNALRTAARLLREELARKRDKLHDAVDHLESTLDERSSSQAESARSRRGGSKPVSTKGAAATSSTKEGAAARAPSPVPAPARHHPAPFPPRHHEPPEIYFVARDFFFNFLYFVLLSFVGAAIFSATETDWMFVDAYYHSMMTATTIGLGDLAPQSQAGRLFGIVHMLASVLLFRSVLQTILDGYERRRKSIRKREMLRKQLDEELILSLDKDGDGVGKAEFVLGMLQILGVLQQGDSLPFLEQFARLDADGDGRLTRADLKALTRENQKRESERISAQEAAAKPPGGEDAATDASRIELQVHENALVLMVPALLASFGFLWYSALGHCLLGGGICHALAVGNMIGCAPGRATHRRSIVLLAIGASCFCAVIFLLTSYIVEPDFVFSFDILVETTLLGTLDRSTGTTRRIERGPMRDLAIAITKDLVQDWRTISMILPYLLTFAYSVFLDFQTIYRCYEAFKASEAEGVTIANLVGWDDFEEPAEEDEGEGDVASSAVAEEGTRRDGEPATVPVPESLAFE